MSDDEITIWLQDLKQELQDFITWSSKRPMRGEIDVANYVKDLWSLAGPLLCADFLSKREYHSLFLQGFYPSDRAKLTPDSERQFQDVVQMMKNNVLQLSEDDLLALLMPSPPAHTPLPPAPETLTSPTDFVASVPAAPCYNPGPIFHFLPTALFSRSRDPPPNPSPDQVT